MTTRYRTTAINDDGGEGTSRIVGGLEVPVANPLSPHFDPTASNPEQLLALAWATCLNATAQAIARRAYRTAVRVDVEMRDALERGGFEFAVTAFVSAEGQGEAAVSALAEQAHARCPISRLLHGANDVAVRTEPWQDAEAA